MGKITGVVAKKIAARPALLLSHYFPLWEQESK
jgi:hypothetical protein